MGASGGQYQAPKMCCISCIPTSGGPRKYSIHSSMNKLSVALGMHGGEHIRQKETRTFHIEFPYALCLLLRSTCVLPLRDLKAGPVGSRDRCGLAKRTWETARRERTERAAGRRREGHGKETLLAAIGSGYDMMEP